LLPPIHYRSSLMCATAGCFFGALSGGYTSEKLGRKPALMISVVIFMVGSIIQLCSGLNSTSLTPLYVGRIIGGWGVGMNSAVRLLHPSQVAKKVDVNIRLFLLIFLNQVPEP
jgi:MFS family permease